MGGRVSKQKNAPFMLQVFSFACLSIFNKQIPINELRDQPQNTTTELVTLGLSNLSAVFPHNGEETRLGFLSLVIYDRSYWDSCWRTNENRHDVIGNL